MMFLFNVERMLDEIFNEADALGEPQKKRVALFGGSFNPPHPGHFEVGKSFKEELGVDEVWFLLSINTHKDSSVYEEPEHLVAMGEILKKHYPDMPFVISLVQHEMGTHITYDVLEELSRRNPDIEFTWVMGADNLIRFHEWDNFEDIIENYPLAIINRQPYTEEAKSSVTALTYPHLIRSSPEELKEQGAGWCFFDAFEFDMSSSDLLKQMRAGQTEFDGSFQDVADYIIEHGLYGISANDNDLNHDPNSGLQQS